MSPIGPASSSPLSGLQRQFERFERAASHVVDITSNASSAATVEISQAARNAGQTQDSGLTSGLEGAMVDLRSSKYLAVANMQVLKTENEVAEAAEAIIR